MGMSPAGMSLRASAIPVTTLVSVLQQIVGRRVTDKTDLKGLFDFQLQFSPEGLMLQRLNGALPPPDPGPGGLGAAAAPSAADPLPSLFTAIQEVGLRLESTKGPVEVVVIDSVQKPTEN